MAQDRRLAREFALLSVCALISDKQKKAAAAMEDLIDAQDEADGDLPGALDDHVREMALLIAQTYFDRRKEIEARMGIFLDRGRKDVSLVEKAAILTALAEHRTSLQTPPPVLINEYMELSKRYGAEGGFRLVNGVLDSIFKDEEDNVAVAAPGKE